MPNVTVQNPVHLFNASGTFPVVLTAGNSSTNQSSSVSKVLDIEGKNPVVASFTALPMNGTAPLLVTFNDTSAGDDIISRSWIFGDGSTGTGQTVNHTYTTAGSYTAVLNVVSLWNNGTAGKMISVESGPTPPVANLTANVTTGTVPLAVRFTDLSSGSPTSWLWNFGDGNTSAVQSPVYVYTVPGLYTVNLTVSNAAGSASIAKPGYINATAEPVLPVADFHANATTGPAPLLVQFTDASSGSPVSWVWDFGDGNFSTEQNPAYEYAAPGLYTVNLTVWNDAGSGSKVKPDYITVTSAPVPPVAGFMTNLTSGPVPLTVQFTDTSTGSPTSWLWNFGDGGSSNQQNPEHTFSNPGLYTINLTVSNSAGSGNLVALNYINATREVVIPAARFVGSPVNGTAPLSVQFTDLSTGSPTSWLWDFGDGNTSTTENPAHTYSVPGLFTVNLTAINTAGSNSSILPDYINVTMPVFFHTITASAGTGGSIMPSGNVTVLHLGSLTFTVDPDPNYSISAVFVDGADMGALRSYTFSNVTVDHQISAVFVPEGNRHSINATADQNTIIYPHGNNTYPEGSNKTYITQARPGSELLNVTVDSVAYPPAESWVFTTIMRDHTINTSGGFAPGKINVFFSLNATNGTSPMAVQFRDLTVGDPVTWFWQFGDGSTSEEQNPVHTYQIPGIYTVSLRSFNTESGGLGVWNNAISVTDGSS
jgi:PKD repeat protein